MGHYPAFFLMEYYQRSIHSNIRTLDEDRFEVMSNLLDLEHSLHLEMTIRLSTGVVESANATMSRVPFKRCHQALPAIAGLAGMQLERGVIKEIHRRIGGPLSCAHLEELVTDAVRLVAMIRMGKAAGYQRAEDDLRSEEERIAASKSVLRDTCIVFADE